MMSIGKLAAGPGAGRDYVDQVAQGREDYYAGEGEAAGRVDRDRRGELSGSRAGCPRRAWRGCSTAVTRPRVCCCGRPLARCGGGVRPDVPGAEEREHPVRRSPSPTSRGDHSCARGGGRRRRSATSSARRAGRVAVSGRDPAAGAGLRRRGVPAPDVACRRSAAAHARGGRERHAGADGRWTALDGRQLYRACEDRRLPLPGASCAASCTSDSGCGGGRRARHRGARRRAARG